MRGGAAGRWGDTLTLVVAAWAAFVSTALAVLEGIRFFRSRATLRVNSERLFFRYPNDPERAGLVEIQVANTSAQPAGIDWWGFSMPDSLALFSYELELADGGIPDLLQPGEIATASFRSAEVRAWMVARGYEPDTLVRAFAVDHFGKAHQSAKDPV